MQQPFLLAFRARLAKRGYKNIHIYVLHYSNQADQYLVKAIEPLGGVGIEAVLSLSEIVNGFRF